MNSPHAFGVFNGLTMDREASTPGGEAAVPSNKRPRSGGSRSVILRRPSQDSSMAASGVFDKCLKSCV